MKVADLLEKRKRQWRELEHLCSRMQNRRRPTCKRAVAAISVYDDRPSGLDSADPRCIVESLQWA